MLIHILKYRLSPAYRKAYDRKVKFMHIMTINKSIMEGFKCCR